MVPIFHWSSFGFVVTFGLYLLLASVALAQEPHQGTVWINPGVITKADPTTFLSLVAGAGRYDRQVRDRRIGKWGIIRAWL